MIVITVIIGVLTLLFFRIKGIRKKVISLVKSTGVSEHMRVLYSEKEAEYQSYIYYEKKIKLILLIVLAGCIFSVGSFVMTKLNPRIGSDNSIDRNGYGEGDKTLSLYLSSDYLSQKEKVQVRISDRKYTPEETEKLSGELINQIYKQICGENTSLDEVMYDLNLMTSIEGYPFKIAWKSEKPTIVSRRGNIDTGRLKTLLEETGEDSLQVKLYATISYEEYEKEMELMANLVLKEPDPEQAFLEEVEKSIETADMEGREDNYVILPDRVEGKHLTYSGDERMMEVIIFAITLLTAGAVYFAKDEELNKQIKERNEQLEDDYPRIVNQYTLYYCAGMNTKSIWREICSDYRKRIRNDSDRRYAFEEMLRTEAFMADGAGENTAYSEFGKSCGIQRYRRFVSLLQQTLSKGKDQMAEDLRKEVEEAFAEKVRIAMVRGEEAGTKLLIPMFMMLGIVLIIVIFPAFINFNIN